MSQRNLTFHSSPDDILGPLAHHRNVTLLSIASQGELQIFTENKFEIP